MRGLTAPWDSWDFVEASLRELAARIEIGRAGSYPIALRGLTITLVEAILVIDEGAPENFMIELTPELRRFVTDPPAGSATARAKEFGYDVVALAIKLATTTPDERLTALDERIADVRRLRKEMP